MNKLNCKSIRQELEESRLGESYQSEVWAHLRDCASCQAFEQEEIALRRLVGSLGTVQAPADFDMKLRARLARSTPHLTRKWVNHPILIACSAVLILVVAVGLFRFTPTAPTATSKEAPSVKEVASVDSQTRAAALPVNENPVAVKQSRDVPRRTAKLSSNSYKSKRNLVAADFSSTAAGALTTRNTSAIFPITGTLQPVNVSLDDGRGNARTISLPGVSFGSQRVVVSNNQLAPKVVW